MQNARLGMCLEIGIVGDSDGLHYLIQLDMHFLHLLYNEELVIKISKQMK